MTRGKGRIDFDQTNQICLAQSFIPHIRSKTKPKNGCYTAIQASAVKRLNRWTNTIGEKGMVEKDT